MNLRNVFISFSIYYILASIIIGSALVYFNIGGVKALDVLILYFVIRYIGESFAKSNGRCYTSSEQTKVILGIILIMTIIQSLFVLKAFTELEQSFSFVVFIPTVMITSTMYAIAIYLFVIITKKSLIKRGYVAG
ncbi:ABZJ_00895 family protein [Thalassotalea hakodatensis]|uniref:ABZJ_00895 family protein n=1 Tax=Thalassotalea hakodatensis TaxID=3030492 RepID=UPI0025743A6E|nr:ABZJ_00895 family protein [Thalassotalea hakodatensis]